MPAQNEPLQYTISQALPILERTRLTVYGYIKSGKLPAILSIIDGSTAWLISHDDLMAFIAKRDFNRNTQRAAAQTPSPCCDNSGFPTLLQGKLMPTIPKNPNKKATLSSKIRRLCVLYSEFSNAHYTKVSSIRLVFKTKKLKIAMKNNKQKSTKILIDLMFYGGFIIAAVITLGFIFKVILL